MTSSLEFSTCQPAGVTFTTSSCATEPRVVFLNILVDMNHDGDWHDAQLCEPNLCAYEWAVKNQPMTMPAGCGTHTSPSFLVGPTPGPSWLRISLTDFAVTDNYPWAGGAGESGVIGGETEDYPGMIQQAVCRHPDFHRTPTPDPIERTPTRRGKLLQPSGSVSRCLRCLGFEFEQDGGGGGQIGHGRARRRRRVKGCALPTGMSPSSGPNSWRRRAPGSRR